MEWAVVVVLPGLLLIVVDFLIVDLLVMFFMLNALWQTSCALRSTSFRNDDSFGCCCSGCCCCCCLSNPAFVVFDVVAAV